MQQLTAKDQAVFRSIVKFYETKQYKKGVKAADSILKKHPEHGETLCMKGLTLSYLDKKEEAYELVRQGLKHDLKSHVCWHVYGLLYRQDRNYYEAVKCYRNALRFDPENIQILRDLSLLQIHRRDLTGFAETRRKLLQVKPSNRLNWVGYAIAEHLCFEFEFAWTCIDNYEKTFKDESVPDYENSELYLYKATIMEEAGKLEDALECLKQHEREIVDKIGLLEMKGRLCMFLQRHGEAAEIYRKLIKMNSEHHHYILSYMANQPQFQRFWPPLPAPTPKVRLDRSLESNGTTETTAVENPPATIASFPVSTHPEGMPIWGWLPPQHSLKPQRRHCIGGRQHKRRCDSYEPLVELTDDEEDDVCKFFDELLAEYPKSDSLQRLQLFFLSGERFQKRIDAYLRKGIKKGIPSLFRMVRPLYFQKGKAELIEQLLFQYAKFLQEEVAWFGPKPGETDAVPPTEETEEAPSCLLFALMVSAEHFDFLGFTEKALVYVDQAIEHTPTFVEIYACKGRIYKHAGDLEKSAYWFNEVRSMDLADRFLNGQCVRACLRVDEVSEAKEKAMLFAHSREPDAPDASNLHDMQAMWYESAVGRSFVRQKNYGKALKEFEQTFKHFNDIGEDQFDFHNYCLRKTTLKSYVAMLRMQERLYSHKFYRRAAKDSIRVYMELFDQKARGEDLGAKAEEAVENAEMSAADKKKAKHQEKRKKKKDDDANVGKATTSGGKTRKVDEDPNGERLLEKAREDPMAAASKHVKNLVLYSNLDAASHVLTYEVMSRQGKLLHCLQALIQLWELCGRDVTAYKLITPLSHFCFVAALADTQSVVQQVILKEVATIFGKESFANIAALQDACKEQVVDVVEKRIKEDLDLPLIEVLYSLKCIKNAGRDFKAFLEIWQPKCAFSLKECKKMKIFLATECGADSAVAKRFDETAKKLFPLMVTPTAAAAA